MTDRQRSPSTPTRRPAAANPQSAPAGNAAFLAPPGATSLAPPPPGLPPLNPNLPAIPPQPWYVRVASATNNAFWHPIDTVKSLNNRGQAALEEAHADVHDFLQESWNDIKESNARARTPMAQGTPAPPSRPNRPNPTTPPTTPVVPGPRAATPPTPGSPPPAAPSPFTPGAPGAIVPLPRGQDNVKTFDISKLNLDLTKMSSLKSRAGNFILPLVISAMTDRESGGLRWATNSSSSAAGPLQYTNDNFADYLVAAKKYRELLKTEYIAEYNQQKEIYDNDLELAEIMSYNYEDDGSVGVASKMAREIHEGKRSPWRYLKKVTIDGKEVWKIDPEKSLFPFHFIPWHTSWINDRRLYLDSRFYPDELAFTVAFGKDMQSRIENIQSVYNVGGVAGTFLIKSTFTESITNPKAVELFNRDRADNERILLENQNLQKEEQKRVEGKRARGEAYVGDEEQVNLALQFPYWLLYVQHFGGAGGVKWLARTDAAVRAAGIENDFQWADPALGSYADSAERPEVNFEAGYFVQMKWDFVKDHDFAHMGPFYNESQYKAKEYENNPAWAKGYKLSELGGNWFFSSTWGEAFGKMKTDTELAYKKRFDKLIGPTIKGERSSPYYMSAYGSVGTPNAAYLFSNYASRINDFIPYKKKMQEALLGKVYTLSDAFDGLSAGTFGKAASDNRTNDDNLAREYNRILGPTGVSDWGDHFFNFLSIFFGFQDWGVAPSTTVEGYEFRPPEFIKAAEDFRKTARQIQQQTSGPNFRIIDIVNPSDADYKSYEEQIKLLNPEKKIKKTDKGEDTKLGRYLSVDQVYIPIEVIPKKT